MVQRRYLPHTEQDRKEMLETIGAASIDELYGDVPEDVLTKDRKLDSIPPAESEVELLKTASALAGKNANANTHAYFLGAGVYDHYIPSIVTPVISRQEFLTAYVPYQPEISQGELQALFEWQTMVCQLTGMDIANSGLYDGHNAVAEAANLAIGQVKKSTKVLISESCHPESIETVETYAFGKEYGVERIGLSGDKTDIEDLKAKIDDETAAVIVQYPNFFGSIEDLKEIKAAMEGSKALLIVSSNPLALAKLEAPGNLGADMVVGDVQPFGIPMSYGGPHCGYMSVTSKLLRKLPSRIVGQTFDAEGKRGFVMALSTREQHIRREKATSNYSSNQALFALASAVAMTALGKEGVQEMAQANINNAHYAASLFEEEGIKVLNQSPFFNEFIVQLDKNPDEVNEALVGKGFIGGYNASKAYGEDNAYLVAVTEKRTKEEIEEFVKAVAEVSK